MSPIMNICFICGSLWYFDPNRRTMIRDIIEQISRKDIFN